MSRSLNTVVEEFKIWNQNLHTGNTMEGVNLQHAFLELHDQTTEFMELVLAWMQAREDGIPPMRVF